VDIFGIGTFEILVILVIALIVVGPDRIPEYARKFGKLMRNFRKMTSNLTGEMRKAIDLDEEAEDIKKTATGMSAVLDEEAKEIGMSLDKEVGEIARTMGIEAEGIKKTLAEGTDELSQLIVKEAAGMKRSAEEVRDVLDKEVKELTRTLDEGTKKLSQAMGGGGEKSGGEVKVAPEGAKKITGESPKKPGESAAKEAGKVKEMADAEPGKVKQQPEAEAPQAPAIEPREGEKGEE